MDSISTLVNLLLCSFHRSCNKKTHGAEFRYSTTNRRSVLTLKFSCLPCYILDTPRSLKEVCNKGIFLQMYLYKCFCMSISTILSFDFQQKYFGRRFLFYFISFHIRPEECGQIYLQFQFSSAGVIEECLYYKKYTFSSKKKLVNKMSKDF